AEEALRRALAGMGGRGLGAHRSAVEQAIISRDSRWMVTRSDDQTFLWDLTSADPNAEARELPCRKGRFFPNLALSPDSRWVFTHQDEGRTLLWDLNDPAARPRELPREKEDIILPFFSPDGHWLVTLSANMALQSTDMALLWDLTGSAPAARLRDQPSL